MPANKKVFFVYWDARQKRVILSDRTSRERGEPRWELLRQFRTIQDARHWVGKQYPTTLVQDDVKSQFTGFTAEARQTMREKKLGALNPNAKGIPEERKERIRRTMTGTRSGENNPMWGMRQRASSRMKTSLTMKQTLPKRRWCIDPMGGEHFVAVDFVLPEGWCWGRNTLKKWERRPRKISPRSPKVLDTH